jgi:hypothetical protein
MPQVETEVHQADGEVGPPWSDVDRRYVALGVPLGRWRDPRDEDAPTTAMIRQGEHFLVVDLDALDVFLLALQPRSRDELIDAAVDAGVEDPIELVDAVLDAGLLVPFGRQPDEDVERLQRLRLQTVGIGLGEDGSAPGVYRVAAHDLTPLLDCDAVTYAVWAASDGRPLARVCEQVGVAYGVTTGDVLRHLLTGLPPLLESGAAFLDLAPGGEGR